MHSETWTSVSCQLGVICATLPAKANLPAQSDLCKNLISCVQTTCVHCTFLYSAAGGGTTADTDDEEDDFDDDEEDEVADTDAAPEDTTDEKEEL